MTAPFNPDLDLQIERLIAARAETNWRCWQEPALLRQWFCPAPVQLTDRQIDHQTGGRLFTEMTLPNGKVMPNESVFVLVDPLRRMVSTDALHSGFRRAGQGFMTVDVTLTPTEAGTRYHAHILHASAAARQTHLDMGFDHGWGTMLDQLSQLTQSL